MPVLTLQTNVDIPAEQQQTLLPKLSSTLSEMLGKSEAYVMISIQAGSSMIFAGNSDPLAYLELKSLGLPEQQTADFSATLCGLLERELAIDPARIYIEFSTTARHMWGWNNKTFG